MFEHREIDDYEKYINERQQGRTGTNGSGLRDDRNRERNQKRKGRMNGVIGFILGIMTSFVLVYVGFAFAFNNGNVLSLFLKRNNKLDYKKIEEKTSVLQNIIDRYFLFDEDMTKVEDGIYAGMMNGLGDPYTVYYTKEEYKALNEDTEGKYSGIGAVVSQNPNTKIITIVKIFDNSPANDAGLQVGDIITMIDGIEMSSYQDVLARMYMHSAGDTVNVSIIRGGESKQIGVVLQ